MGHRKHKVKRNRKSLIEANLQTHYRQAKGSQDDPDIETVHAVTPITPDTSKPTPLQACLIILVIGLAIFATGLANPFIGDDSPQIVNNPVVHSITHIKLFFEGSTFYSGGGIAPLTGNYYRPLMTTTYSLLYTLFGSHQFYFHLLQALLCIGSACLLYLVFRYMFTSILALVLSLVFLVHPLNSQIAFAIPSMQDALFFFFGVLALWLLLRFNSVKSLLLVALCLMMSLLSKETAIVFIVVAALYLFWFDRKRLFVFTGIVAVPIVFYFLLKTNAIGFIGTKSTNGPIDNLSMVGRLMTMPSLLLFFFTKLIWPWKLASGYYWVYPTFSVRHVLLPLVIDLIVIGLFAYMAYVIRRRESDKYYRAYMFFGAWTLLGLLPHLQIIPLDMTACETWFYFSVAGVLGMIGVMLVAFQAHIDPTWFFVGVIVVAGVLGIRTAVRGLDYKSYYILSRHDVVASKEDYPAYNAIGKTLIDQGNYADAKTNVERSISIYPSFLAYLNLGVILTNQGDYPGAAAAYQKGLKLGNASVLYDDLAALTLFTGDPNANKQLLLSGLKKFPQDHTLWMYLAILEDRYGDNKDAWTSIQQAATYGQVPPFIYDNIMRNQPFTINIANRAIKIQ